MGNGRSDLLTLVPATWVLTGGCCSGLLMDYALVSRVGLCNCGRLRVIVQLSPNLGVACSSIGHVLHLEGRQNLVVWLRCFLSGGIVDQSYESGSL